MKTLLLDTIPTRITVLLLWKCSERLRFPCLKKSNALNFHFQLLVMTDLIYDLDKATKNNKFLNSLRKNDV